MAFESLTEFFRMGGYGGYVWSSMAISVISLLSLVISTRRRTASLRDELNRRDARAQRMSEASREERHI